MLGISELELALSPPDCTSCRGLGRRRSRESHPFLTCACVYRKISRLVIARTQLPLGNQGVPALYVARTGGYQFSYPSIEYMVDVGLVMRRTLGGVALRAFVRHAIDGADYRVICRELNLTRGIFFHHLYRAEAQFGRAAELAGLYPLRNYFSARYVATEQVGRRSASHAVRTPK